MSVANTIAMQLDNTKPDTWRPGPDVGMMALADDNALGVLVNPINKVAVVNYDSGADEYDVAVADAPTLGADAMLVVAHAFRRMLSAIETEDSSLGIELHHGLGCEQIGEFVWGEQAKPFTLPIVAFSEDGENWDVIA